MTDNTELPTKAISIRQPWAWAIIYAGKDIENRDWNTRFRGPVAIHAAKGMATHEYAGAAKVITAIKRKADSQHLMRWLGVCAAPERLDRGGIIGTAEIVDCVEQSDSPWFFGRYGFVLRNVRPVEFIPVKGALGFFDWQANLEGNQP